MSQPKKRVARKETTQAPVMVPVSQLHFFEGNPKKFTSKQFKKLLVSIKDIGIVEPLTVNRETGTVLNGNQRMKAAMQLEIRDVPVRYVNYSPAEEAKILIHLNETLAEKDEAAMQKLMGMYPEDAFIQEMAREYAEALGSLGGAGSSSAEFAIVKEVDEKYDYIVFVTNKSVDYLNIETFFNLDKVYDQHKQKLIGKGRVVLGDQLSKLIAFVAERGIKNINEL